MFDTKTLYRFWRRIRPLKTWYFFAAFLAAASISIAALRENNLHMVSLRSAVYQADKNNADVAAALKKLQAYVVTHMNTSLTTGSGSVYPPIQLKYTYDRLQAAANQAAQAANGQVYTDAQHYCEQQDSTDFSGKNRVPCIESYVAAHGVKVQTVPDALYKFDFFSPVWSPDLAGWSLVASGVLFVASVVRFVLGVWLRRRVG